MREFFVLHRMEGRTWRGVLTPGYFELCNFPSGNGFAVCIFLAGCLPAPPRFLHTPACVQRLAADSSPVSGIQIHPPCCCVALASSLTSQGLFPGQWAEGSQLPPKVVDRTQAPSSSPPTLTPPPHRHPRFHLPPPPPTPHSSSPGEWENASSSWESIPGRSIPNPHQMQGQGEEAPGSPPSPCPGAHVAPPSSPVNPLQPSCGPGEPAGSVASHQ